MKYITKQGLVKLEEELKERKTKTRRLIASAIKEAKEHGDLSENAEYTEARRQQRENEARIMELENVIRTSKVVSENGNGHGVVSVGSKVAVKVGGKQLELSIVGQSEFDPLAGKISNESPIGRALIGRKVGNKVEISLPNGKAVVYEIVAIE